jgi:hypothetical protein
VTSFELKDSVLSYDPEKSLVVCRTKGEDRKKIWIKKLEDAGTVTSVLEDGERYFLACEYGESEGAFLALEMGSGVTVWYIPGRSFLQVIYEGYLFMIFIDERGEYFLIKVECAGGSTVWHHRVESDLAEYRFNPRRIRLFYESGREETLDSATGLPEKF